MEQVLNEGTVTTNGQAKKVFYKIGDTITLTNNGQWIGVFHEERSRIYPNDQVIEVEVKSAKTARIILE